MAFLLPALGTVARFALPMLGRAIGSLGGIASRAIPRIASIGKSVLPRALSAIGKVQAGVEMGKAIGKSAREAIGSVNPEFGKKIDQAYNQKLIGGMSTADLVNHGQNVLNQSKDIAQNAKNLLANKLPDLRVDKSAPSSNYNSANYNYT